MRLPFIYNLIENENAPYTLRADAWQYLDLATTAVPNTAGYQNWQTISTAVSLQAGTQFLTVYVQTGGWNLNWWRLTPL